MMRLITGLTALTLLAACGIDGPPEPRQKEYRRTSANGMDLELGADTGSGVTVSGQARFGVVSTF